MTPYRSSPNPIPSTPEIPFWFRPYTFIAGHGATRLYAWCFLTGITIRYLSFGNHTVNNVVLALWSLWIAVCSIRYYRTRS